jgi:hypothetical protein
MNYDVPNQIKPWENKKSAAFKKWLAAQVKLDPSRWNQDFIEYLKLKEAESEEKVVYVEPTPEQVRANTFERYLGGLDVAEQDLKEKSILDVGCGDGDFVVACMEKGLTQHAFGMDRDFFAGGLDEKYRGNFFPKQFSDIFPVKNLDYIFSVGAISLYLDEQHEIDAEDAIKSSIRAIKKTGEVRIWPIKKALKGEQLDGIKEEEMVLARIMEYLGERFEIEWELIPTDVRVSGRDKDVWADQVLVIRHKPVVETGNE